MTDETSPMLKPLGLIIGFIFAQTKKSSSRDLFMQRLKKMFARFFVSGSILARFEMSSSDKKWPLSVGFNYLRRCNPSLEKSFKRAQNSTNCLGLLCKVSLDSGESSLRLRSVTTSFATKTKSNCLATSEGAMKWLDQLLSLKSIGHYWPLSLL